MRALIRIAACSASLLACGKSPPFTTAAHNPLPLLQAGSGAVLKTPRLVTITYADYEFRGQAEAFGDFIVGSDWLRNAGAEYGISPGTHLPVRLADPSPGELSDRSAIALLNQRITSGELPAPDGQTLYMLYVSASTIFSDVPGADACDDEGAHHSAAAGPAQGYPYAIILDCGATFDDVSYSASHELIEAATDPFLDSYLQSLGPLLPPDNDLEIADLCENEAPVSEGGFKVTRTYSNAAASRGSEPCLPKPAGDVYYNVSVAPSTVQHASPGETVSFELTGWSEAEIAPWVLIPVPGRLSQMNLGVSIDVNRIGNGDHATLKLTVPVEARSGQAGYVNLYSAPNWVRDALAGVVVD
jgi:hypothetical protein